MRAGEGIPDYIFEHHDAPIRAFGGASAYMQPSALPLDVSDRAIHENTKGLCENIITSRR